MDFLTKHIAILPRCFSLAPKIENIGCIPRKTDTVKRIFDTFNFSFILSGRGVYYHQGEKYEVKAPCVIIQTPGDEMNYAPYDCWEEVFFIYGAESFELLRAGKLWRENIFMWPIPDVKKLRRQIEVLLEELENLTVNTFGDQIDHMAEGIILSSMRGLSGNIQGDGKTGKYEKIISSAAGIISAAPERYYDFDEMAAQFQISSSTFRNYFQLYRKMPAGRFLAECRMRTACRLLVETTLPMNEVARLSGYHDALYFSRRFHTEIGMPPSEYRRKHFIS